MGFLFNNEANYKDHLQELQKKGIVAVKRTWGLGERKCANDFKRRKMMFDYLVRSVMAYELWGWKERKNLEKIQLDYL